MPYSMEMLNDPICIKLCSKQNEKELCSVLRTNEISSEIKMCFPTNWTPSPCVLTPNWNKVGEAIQNFKIYEDDVWIFSHPKCGTTWVQEMVWMICNDFDIEKGKNIPMTQRCPFLELESIIDIGEDALSVAINLPRPRLIKSHLPISLLPDELWTKKPKMLYISRNPKDVIVSYYNHHIRGHNYQGTLEEYVEAFLADRTLYSPFYDHIIDFYAIKSLPNILYLTFEDMKEDLRSQIIQTAIFLDRLLIDGQIDLLLNHLSFNSMKNNKSVNLDNFTDAIAKKWGRNMTDIPKFMRKGLAGGWRSELSQNWADKIDEKTQSKVKNRRLLRLFESP